MKKSLLNESEIRKFMKFANLTKLTENFIDRSLEEEVEAVNEEEISEEVDTVTEEEVNEETVTEEVLEEEEGHGDTESFLEDMVDLLKKFTGEDISVQKGEEEMGDLEMDEPMGDEEEEAEMAPSPEMPGDDDMMSGSEEEGDEEPPMDDLVMEVPRRVAARLLNEAKK